MTFFFLFYWEKETFSREATNCFLDSKVGRFESGIRALLLYFSHPDMTFAVDWALKVDYLSCFTWVAALVNGFIIFMFDWCNEKSCVMMTERKKISITFFWGLYRSFKLCMMVTSIELHTGIHTNFSDLDRISRPARGDRTVKLSAVFFL